jgi:DNA-binding transcriptional LysR family regulator
MLIAVEGLPALRDVRCFVAVAEHGSFSRAAARLGLSQPAVSQAVARLEQVLDCRLFDRTSRRVHPTPAGRALLAPATALLAEATAFAATARELGAAAHPSITLAYPPLLGTFVARLARRLSRHEPTMSVRLQPLGRRAAAEAVTAGDATAAILTAPLPTSETPATRSPAGSGAMVTGIPLLSLGLDRLAVPAGDALAARSVIRPTALRGHRLLVPADRPPGGPWARLVAALPARGAATRITEIADDIDDWPAALDLVAAGLGVLPVPSLLASTVRRPDVTYTPLEIPTTTAPPAGPVPGASTAATAPTRGAPPAAVARAGAGVLFRLVWRGGGDEGPGAGVLAVVRAAQEVLRTR